MRHTMQRLGLFAASVLGSCAGPVAAPPHYAVLPASEIPRAFPSFSPSADLQAVTLACEGEELRDNGVDDDCDGSVDGERPAASDFTIALAGRAEAADQVRLGLTREAATDVPNLDPLIATVDSPAVHVRRVLLSGFESGRYRVTATRQGATEEPAQLPIFVSLATSTTVQSYVVTLGAGETRNLGTITIP